MSKEKNEVAVLPNKLNEVVQTGGVELSKAEKIASGYAPLMNQAQEIAEKLKCLDVNNPEHVAIARRARIDLGTLCSTTGKQKDSDKEIVKIEDRFIMALHNTVVNFAKLTQEDAKAIEQHAERVEAARIEALRVERMKELEEFEVLTNDAHVENMSDDVWKNYKNGVKLNYEQVKAAEAQAELERIETERKTTVFSERKMELLPLSDHTDVAALTIDTTEDEFKTLIENAKAAKVKAAEEQKEREAEAEKTRLKAEAEAKKAREEKAKSDAELAKVQASAKKEREEAEKKAEEQRVKLAKIEAEKAASEKLEAERIEKEQADKKAAEQAPDKDKIKAALKDMNMPALYFKSKDVAETYSEIESKFLAFKAWADKQVEAIK